MALYGLAVCGGKSSRMGSDKSQLQYFGIPQADRVLNVLSPLCEDVFLSCNSSQSANFENHKIITDLPAYQDIGPMAALLSAFEIYPNADFLIAGCDYPFITTEVFRGFLSSIQKVPVAAAFYNVEGTYEPLLAWYAREAAPLLFERFESGRYSLQHFLREINAEKYIPESENIMLSVDTPEICEKVQALLNVHDDK
ncbi:molybdenum cofactor guanylyltransferase [Dyadobacter psychrophilus]|uniref:Probable molybdenum cofactor guanylyltransferase n=1 Tax=Dyadobacter psychrophilus TaxID=651661 RepID=A0A1T5FCV2_9BACT|nr:molybdenum cofactor guanylyltransferase [Dyadobacter psychrophilus]SKB93926.1 molybdopterin-guanine dinucleotide biosynthesis protein A [Dyadobacter psychrophilus]